MTILEPVLSKSSLIAQTFAPPLIEFATAPKGSFQSQHALTKASASQPELPDRGHLLSIQDSP